MDSSTEKAAPEAVPDIEKAQEPPKDDAPPVRTIHGFKVLSGALARLIMSVGPRRAHNQYRHVSLCSR